MANYSSDLSSFMPEHELVELLWEDGQIVMQGQSNRTKKSSFVTELGFNGRVEDKGCGDEATVVKFGQTGAADSAAAHGLVRSVPSAMNSHEDDTAHCMNYLIDDDSLQNDYCSEFFSEITGGMPSLSNTSSSLNPADKIAGFGQSARDSCGFRSSPAAPEPSKSSRFNHLFGMPQQCQIFSENAKSRVLDLDSSTNHHSSNNNINTNTNSKRFQKQDAGVQKPSQKATSAGLLNFSHFSRPAALVKANLHSIERLHEKSSCAAARTYAVESTLVDSGSNGKPMANRSSSSHCQNSSFAVSMMNKGRNEAERASETVVASSSVCSGYSAGAASNDRKHKSKKRAREGEESGEQSDDLEDDSFAVKELSSGRGSSGKRSRAAEVHNLSERRRRDRINEKMKALQELIPNCNKVDKASMLDEAIEYLKTLQLQVQMMSMGSGLCMTPMMLPAGMNVQHLHAPQMASFSPLGVGMGIGMGMGLGFGMGMIDLNGSPGLIPVPPMPGGTQFSCSSVPAVPGLYRMPHSSAIHSLGMPAQRFPVSLSPQKALLNPWQVSDTSPSASQIKQQHCINLEPKGEASQAACHKDSQAELHGSGNLTVKSIKGTTGTG